MSGKLKWYAARLATMSPAEISHRFIELARKRSLARLRRGWNAFDEMAGARLADLHPLRLALAGASSLTVSEVLKGQRYLGRVLSCVGSDENAGADFDWFADPVSGRRWPGPESAAFAIDVRSTSAVPTRQRPFGDVKYVWEPNRLQILHPLAAIIARGGSQAAPARDMALSIVRSWMEANPPYRGVNWVSGIELALRLVSIALLVAAAGARPWSARESGELARFIAAHAHMLAALPSLHSSANNHRVAEGLGLFLAGVLLPDQRASGGWRASGRAILEEEIARQITPDGVGGEQSPTYQAFTMELAAFGALVAAQAGAPLSHPTIERLRAGARFLCDVQDCNGNIPAIGDDDEGRAIHAPHEDEPHYVASVAACVARLCGHADGNGLAPGYFRERLFDAPPRPGQARESLNVYPDGGYSILSRKLAGRDVHLVFDHGPLGYLSLAAHGHADALSIWLSVDGRPVFIDAGTWLYHSGQARRNALRSSAAHNTLSLPGMSQSEPSAAFSWASKARAWRVDVTDQPLRAHEWRMGGEHDGYSVRAGVIHRREIIGGDKGFVIADRLIGAKTIRPVEIAFLCAPDVVADVRGDQILLRWAGERAGRVILQMSVPTGFAARVAPAEFSPRFGVLAPTARILLCGDMQCEAARIVFEFGASEA